MQKKGRDWKLKLNALYAYDDNVVHTPSDNTLRPVALTRQVSDSIFETSGTGTYFLAPMDKVKVRLEYDIDFSLHSHLHEYDLASQMFSVTPTYKFTPLMNVQFQYSYIYNIVDGNSFSGIHYLSPSFNHMSRKFGFTRIHYTFKNTNNWKFDTRDNDQNGAGISHYFFFFKQEGRLNLAYDYTHDNTQGRAFKRNSHDFKVALKTPLIYEIDLDADADFSIRDYKERVADNGVSTRRDVQQVFSIDISRVLAQRVGCLKRLTAEAGYRHTFNSTNLDINEYRSNRARVGLRALF